MGRNRRGLGWRKSAIFAFAIWGAAATAEITTEHRDALRGLSDASFSLVLDEAAFQHAGWSVAARSLSPEPNSAATLAGAVEPGSLLGLEPGNLPLNASIRAPGAVLLMSRDKRLALAGFTLRKSPDSDWVIDADHLGPDGTGVRGEAFRLADTLIDASGGTFRLAADLLAGQALVQGGVVPEGTQVGSLTIFGRISEAVVEAAEPVPFAPAETPKRTAGVIGPDVIVGDLHEVATHVTSGGITAISVGTVSCNIGDAPLKWFANTNQHPVIAQNMYRLKGGRFEQIGQSWLKHGFFALSDNLCFSNCQPTDGTYLGIHCSDPYSALLNGQQGNLGPRYQVNAHTGFFNYPPASPSYTGLLARRLQVSTTSLDPNQNAGAVYFVEGQYVTPDDAAAGNQNNNASFRPVSVSPNGNSYTLTLTGSTRRQKSAIRAWRENDPSVQETDVQVPDDGLFIIAAKTTDLGGGQWQYEYAVQNLNSHRSAKAFAVPIDPMASVQSIGFHDVNYHSGEPFSSTDWTSSVSGGFITWTTEDYSANQNANALRWSTLYNFRFTANRQPQSTEIRIDLFRPGTPTSVTATMVGPLISQADCNENGIPDTLEIQNGTVVDCDGDFIPDECESFPVAAVPIATGLDRPVYVTSPPGDPRLFIVEQSGRIKVLENGAVLASAFLDISSSVSSTGERGLLSMAFHPNYAANGAFFVNYTNLAGDTVIARYTVSGNPNVANPGGALVLKTISQDLANHNGGQLQFGPDGYLYVGMGDGGGNNDAFNRAQDTGSLLGKMLRLDVDASAPHIPDSNPYASPGLPLDEIWSMGFRNPWRFSFDRQTGDLYIADVGEAAREEVNLQPADSTGGENYGWRCMEGSTCTGLSGCTCNAPAISVPIFEYPHAGGDCAIVGGYVYRGCAIPNLQGAYVYADYCSGRVGSFRAVGGMASDQQDLTGQIGSIPSIVSFGENADGELFIVSSGIVYRLVPDPDGGAICGNGIIESGELCDDGNTAPGDGCDENCLIETGPPNDRCVVPTAVGDGVYAFDNSGANLDGPADADACVGVPDAIGGDIWYCYTAEYSGVVSVDTCGSFLNTVLQVYDGCDCPAGGSALTCDNDGCGQFGSNSEVSFAATACEPYMIRVSGVQTEEGSGILTVTNTAPPLVNDCDGNGIEDADDILCGSQHDSNGNQIPDTCETDGDFVRGGRLYDQWWTEAAVSAPATDHPLWGYRPDLMSNAGQGATTWRCKECHGWDYAGVDGQYGAGPHRTGFAGILGTTLDASELFTLLKEPPSNGGGGAGVFNGHDFGSVLSDTRINDLVAFILVGAGDTGPYVNSASGDFNGNAAVGQIHYTSGPAPACIACHGSDGTNINFGTEQQPEYLGTIAVQNPWEMLHKIRFGQPGAPMPSWLANGGTTPGAADIGRYVQVSFPTDCTLDAHCEDGHACTTDFCDPDGRCVHDPDDLQCQGDGFFCTGIELCNPNEGCASAGNPCTDPAQCNEPNQTCGCLTPLVEPIGCRYLAISAQPEAVNIPMALIVAADCPGAVPKHVGVPSGPDNIALLVDDPAQAAYLTPAEWGQTVYVTGIQIVPDTAYVVMADCGVPGQPVVTAPAMATTPPWGDVTGPPNGGSQVRDGVANVIDIAAVVDGVREVPQALPVYHLDLYGCLPNQRVDVVDIAGCVDGVKNIPFESSLCPGPCP